jgi:hypothetical protein
MIRTRSLVTTLAACSVAVVVCIAAEAQMGTWKLNEAKSKFGPGMARNHTVVYAPAGDNIKITVVGTDGSGKPLQNEWTGKFDGKEYAVTGEATADKRSYKRVDERTLELTGTKGGKITQTGTIVVSPDGKTRTVTINATTATGEKVSGTAVYEKAH